MKIHLQSKFFAVGLLDQNVNIYVVCLRIATFLSIRVCSIWERLFVPYLTDKVCCQALNFLPLICIYLIEDKRNWMFFHMFSSHFYLFFGELSFMSFPIFLSGFCYPPSLTYEATDSGREVTQGPTCRSRWSWNWMLTI